MYYLIKIIGSAVLITLISEIAKKSSFWGAVLASLPFISIIAFVFLFIETKDINQISQLSKSIFWLVIPSLVLFIALPLLLKNGVQFPLALIGSCLLTILSYYLMTLVLGKLGISL